MYIPWNIIQQQKIMELMQSAAKRMDLEINILREVSQKQKDKYHISHIWNLTYDTTKLVYETDSQAQKTHRATKWEEGRRINQEFGIKIYKLLYG